MGRYAESAAVGTAHARVVPVDNLARTPASASDPASYGMVAAYDAGLAASTSFTHATSIASRTGSIAAIRAPLNQLRNIAVLNFLIAKNNGTVYSSPNNATCDVSLYIEKEIIGQNQQVEYVYEYVGKLNLTCGSTTVNANSTILNTNARFVDTIVVAEDVSLSPGLRVTGQPATPAQTIAAVQVDTKGGIALVAIADNASVSANIFVGMLLSQV